MADSLVTVVILVLGLSQVASAAVASHPYTGVTSRFSDLNVGGCASGKQSQRASFSLKNGDGGVAGVASAKAPCGKVLGSLGTYSYANVVSGVEFAIPIKIHAGQTNVTANLALSAIMSTSISYASGTCPTTTQSYVDPLNASYDSNTTYGTCGIDSAATLVTVGELIDTTNHSHFGINWTNLAPCQAYGGYTYCDEPSFGNHSARYMDILYYTFGPGSANCKAGCSASFNVTYGTSWNSTSATVGLSGWESFTAYDQGSQAGWKFNPKHSYVLLEEFYMQLETDVSKFRSGVAQASLVALPATGGGLSLTSVVTS